MKPEYDYSDRELMVRGFRETKVYMASHPEIRKCFRSRERPTEFGDKVWEMTLRMMTHLEGEPWGWVLEIGCGWGLLGIHLARVTGASVTCLDVDHKLEPLVLKHATLNGVTVVFKKGGLGGIREADLACDLLVGSEICYCEPLRIELCELADRAAKGGTKRLMIADPGRPDFEDLYEYCREKHGAELTDIRLPGESNPSYLMSIRF